MPTLVVEDLTKSYPTPAEPLVVLDGVSLALEAGSSLAIVGPSGSGKSTLLALLGALDRPTSGRVLVEGQDPAKLSDAQLPPFRAANVGFVFQEHYLLPQCTVLENVLAPLLADRSAGPADHDRARALLDRVGLSSRLTHRPAELSGGERQRAAIARALIRDPLLLLADEPTGNLDRTSAAQASDLLAELQRERSGVLVVVTHSETLANAMQRRVRLDAGRLVDDGT